MSAPRKGAALYYAPIAVGIISAMTAVIGGPGADVRIWAGAALGWCCCSAIWMTAWLRMKRADEPTPGGAR